MREFRCLAEYGIESSANLLNTEWGETRLIASVRGGEYLSVAFLLSTFNSTLFY
ncbi:hypothetical protein COO91_02372 [Nostoc flagelliforme CCNUN1]|uniref:Uncharacterized protein n=1 Tax=Nostoc flagelliforme CCNUN1 TaxID=2038116 RepID=A0A2K8SM68_9NOSO|nr:hypothetical protein COO91_02372 [Nostoc flagelliforme CCNUN1]